ncbi:MAG: hypothetical protein A3I89_00030 [Candidatus Harrisonbacteria bacterium RIFCSPLOWO2_02_FULL_41_11]|uniref:Probable nicotinate-nucleotide adenylyltransferase n=1 Tax=Candidatus Harrisonbacteria bacterium RIFCSPHIGHO2_02_FULL_42_16 TaxID=1798404 RepID=A0A1G1ZFL6_9BACT|nr:MAG: hypothetical protein A3B92_03475 [Candidatus Harrisonbacteria bacterium RIFCSPHIGHO2_02_FULL_42_16]OGY66799.1 MAG: hypothetical protein A3I89_00030 [Candidatus Harrisonbacteria bacterium RIFCSPLOWO2_02_FULL_41_11]
MNKKIVIYGGTFNPPHAGHEKVIRILLAESLTDEIWLLPSGDRLDKKISVSGSHRRRMLEILLAKKFSDSKIPVKISDLELRQKPPTYTYKTKKILDKRYPNREFYFAVGTDSLNQLKSEWQYGKELFRHLNFIGIRRSNFPLKEKPKHLRMLKNKSPALSSAEIRKLLALGKSSKTFKNLLIPEILDYIKNNHLY